MNEILLKLPPLPVMVRNIKVAKSLVTAAIEVLKEAPNILCLKIAEKKAWKNS